MYIYTYVDCGSLWNTVCKSEDWYQIKWVPGVQSIEPGDCNSNQNVTIGINVFLKNSFFKTIETMPKIPEL